jgi:type I restriction enzyme S subunit
MKICVPSDIILSVRAPVGTIAKNNTKACIGRGVCAIRPHAYSSYIYQFLLFFEKQWAKVSQGSTFDAVSGNEIRKIVVPIRDNMVVVSSILCTADKKVSLLLQEITQWHQKKKALMQLLLTGLVRV